MTSATEFLASSRRLGIAQSMLESRGMKDSLLNLLLSVLHELKRSTVVPTTKSCSAQLYPYCAGKRDFLNFLI
jgi:hypothetical protein